MKCSPLANILVELITLIYLRVNICCRGIGRHSDSKFRRRILHRGAEQTKVRPSKAHGRAEQNATKDLRSGNQPLPFTAGKDVGKQVRQFDEVSHHNILCMGDTRAGYLMRRDGTNDEDAPGSGSAMAREHAAGDDIYVCTYSSRSI